MIDLRLTERQGSIVVRALIWMKAEGPRDSVRPDEITRIVGAIITHSKEKADAQDLARTRPSSPSTPMVSIVIPTSDRASFLREALASVRKQTAREAISQIVVSENSTNDESRAICGEFADLPIVYRQQKPPVPPLLHGQSILELVRSPLVACLHDDDWWAPEHLASALGVLNREPKCAAVFSSHFLTQGPQFPFQVSEKLWRVWASQKLGLSSAEIILDEVGVLLVCLFDATFHYSTLVGRSKPVRDAIFRVVEAGNAYDNDRTFPVFLSAHGSIAYLVQPDVFVRLHSGQDCLRPEYDERGWAIKSETTRWLLKTDPANGAAAALRFNELAKMMDIQHLAALSRTIGEPLRTTLIQECGFDLVPSAVESKTKGLVKQVCPPIVLEVARQMLIRGGGWRHGK